MTYRPIEGVRLTLAMIGHARHGKDEAAKMLLRILPGAERFALSDALSVECRVHHGMGHRDPRVLQDVGMKFRAEREGVWLRCLYHAIEDRRPEVAVITGVRFHDEAQMVRDMGGRIVRIVRTERGQRYVSPDRNPNHAAEREIDALHADTDIVAESGDMQGLERGLRLWLREITRPCELPRPREAVWEYQDTTGR